MIRFASLPALLVLACAAPAQVKDDPYYPLKVGTTWHYRIGEKKLQTKVTKYEKVGDVMCARVETIIDGNPMGVEHIALTPEGVARFQINGTKPDKPLVFLKLPPKKGDTWKVDTKIATESIKGEYKTDETTVKVPESGDKEYNAIQTVGDFDVNGQPAQFKYWFVKDKGIVKVLMVLGGADVLMELEKFEPGK